MPPETDLTENLDFQTSQGDSSGEDTQPPTAQRVARRMLAMMAVSARGLIEPYSNELDADLARLDILTWLDQIDVWSEFEDLEREVLNTPVGELDPPDDIDAAWKIEGVATLAWALGLYDLSQYDVPVHVGELRDIVKYLSADAKQLIDEAKLRSPEELDKFAFQIFALHWRLNHFFWVDRKAMDFVGVAAKAKYGALDIEMARLINGDLAIKETALVDALDEERQICNGIIAERHRAANWLSGYDELYSQVDVST